MVPSHRVAWPTYGAQPTSNSNELLLSSFFVRTLQTIPLSLNVFVAKRVHLRA
jgi:hypothetical protein